MMTNPFLTCYQEFSHLSKLCVLKLRGNPVTASPDYSRVLSSEAPFLTTLDGVAMASPAENAINS